MDNNFGQSRVVCEEDDDASAAGTMNVFEEDKGGEEVYEVPDYNDEDDDGEDDASEALPKVEHGPKRKAWDEYDDEDDFLASDDDLEAKDDRRVLFERKDEKDEAEKRDESSLNSSTISKQTDPNEPIEPYDFAKLPEAHCAYCGIHDPAVVVQCQKT